MLITSYIKISWRSITKNRKYSLINITGLLIGLTCALLIGLYVQHETTYDRFNQKYKQIYRLESDFTISGKTDQTAVTPIPFGPVFQEEVPGVETYVRFRHLGERLFQHNDIKHYEKGVFMADSTVFQIFDYQFIYGDPESALDEPFSIVLTESMAKKYFGKTDVVGKVLEVDGNTTSKITGVIEDVPANSHIQFDALASMSTLRVFMGQRYDSRDPNMFWGVSMHTFILINENNTIDQILDKYPMIYDKYMAPVGDRLNARFDVMATRLDKIHLNSKLQWDLPVGSKSNVIIFSMVAVFILIIAAINYMNLATARSSKRAREVGIRKVAGAFPGQLRRQFMIESLMLTLISFILALILAEILLPAYENVIGIEFDQNIFRNTPLILAGFAITIFTGLFAGSYPSFFLSSFSPVKVLKGRGNIKTSAQHAFMRKGLVILQFTISTAMIIGTLIVLSQINYIENKDLGFNKEDVILTQVRDTSFIRKMPAFSAEVLKSPDVNSFGSADNVPGNELGMIVFKIEIDGQMSDQTVKLLGCDPDYTDVMEMDIVLGRKFDRNNKPDFKQAFIVNEKATEVFGWKNDAIGKKIQLGSEKTPYFRQGKVVGVVKDFNFVSLHNEVEPLILIPREACGVMYMRINSNNREAAIADIEKSFKSFYPQYPFSYSFLDDRIREKYDAENKAGAIFGYFALITILISCLGLFGLSSFVTDQRIKEIGIRKVLGATINKILFLLSKDYISLVLIANILAYPLAWYALDRWLRNFAYSTSIHWWFFPVATVLTIIIALSIINIKAWNAAKTNPADTLKYE